MKKIIASILFIFTSYGKSAQLCEQLYPAKPLNLAPYFTIITNAYLGDTPDVLINFLLAVQRWQKASSAQEKQQLFEQAEKLSAGFEKSFLLSFQEMLASESGHLDTMNKLLLECEKIKRILLADKNQPSTSWALMNMVQRAFEAEVEALESLIKNDFDYLNEQRFAQKLYEAYSAATAIKVTIARTNPYANELKAMQKILHERRNQIQSYFPAWWAMQELVDLLRQHP